MADIYCYSYVEDAPSAAVIVKLVQETNAQSVNQVIFREGFPLVAGGCTAIKEKCANFLNMARAGLYTISLTDLDSALCASGLIRDWFCISPDEDVSLPEEVVFRVAVREVESWILADSIAWRTHVGIPAGNFSSAPDTLCDPKQHLLDVVRRKGTRKVHKEMLPSGSASIGPKYNEVLCEFVEQKWSPTRAAKNSPSLARAISALIAV